LKFKKTIIIILKMNVNNQNFAGSSHINTNSSGASGGHHGAGSIGSNSGPKASLSKPQN
jgi:hypothetical protein